MHPSEWKTGEIAHDLLAQLAELRAAGAPDAGLTRALEREGMAPGTAAALVRQSASIPASIGLVRPDVALSPGVPHQESPEQVRVTEYGVDLAAVRVWLRQLPRDQAPAELVMALVREGVDLATAQAAIGDIHTDCQAMHERQRQRLALLGAQGVVAGVLFTVYFCAVTWTAWNTPQLHANTPGLSATPGQWNALTALITAGLTMYSGLLWYRHRPTVPGPSSSQPIGGGNA